jgi:hypothetical protein
MTAPIDSIPRVSARKLFLALRQFKAEDNVTLETLRLKFCDDRNTKRMGASMFATAVIVAGEMQKLGLVESGPLPKVTTKMHGAAKDKKVRISESGKELLRLFVEDRGAAFDKLFARMYSAHRNLRSFVAVILERNLFAPVITSVKDHVGSAYGSASALAKAVAEDKLDIDEMLRLLAQPQRMGRSLSEEETAEIRAGVEKLAKDSKMSALSEDGTEFAKNFVSKLNDVVVPAVFRAEGLPFDYRTHRTIWSLGEEFKLWGTTTSHPDHNGTVVYRTATITLSDDREEVKGLVFDSGPTKTGENFLGKMFATYQKLHAIRKSSRKSGHVNAWELRAVFCLDNHCQHSVFNRLFEENYRGSDAYSLHFEIQQVKSRVKSPDQVPLRAGRRSVGTILMIRE